MNLNLRNREYFVREAILSIKRNRLMSIASISTVAISLIILGLFVLMIINMNNMANFFESQMQLTAYIREGTDKSATETLGEEIKKLPGVTQVKFIGKEEALQRLTERLGEQKELLDSLGDTNPLPNAYEVYVDTPERVKEIADGISGLNNVEFTSYRQEVIEQLFSLTRILRIGGAVLIVFLTFATLFIISNTIRITVFSRRKEVSIMKYVGATNWFIRWPFLLEGMLLGLIGSLLAAGLLSWAYGLMLNQLYASLAFLPLVPRTPLLYYVSGCLLAIGIGIGMLGSSISLHRFLKV